MGNSCSTNACNTDGNVETAENEASKHPNTSRLDLNRMNILEFETRVKRFAHPINRGRVTVDQLVEAFSGTRIFDQLHNPFSLVYKLLLSPFFRDLPLSHY